MVLRAIVGYRPYESHADFIFCQPARGQLGPSTCAEEASLQEAAEDYKQETCHATFRQTDAHTAECGCEGTATRVIVFMRCEP